MMRACHAIFYALLLTVVGKQGSEAAGLADDRSMSISLG
jgi:hypothetical protein